MGGSLLLKKFVNCQNKKLTWLWSEASNANGKAMPEHTVQKKNSVNFST